MWFIGVEVEQATSAPPPKKNLDPPPYTYFNVHAFGNSVPIHNYYMILCSSATPKRVKNYPFRSLLKRILCYHGFAKKGTMYKQSQV